MTYTKHVAVSLHEVKHVAQPRNYSNIHLRVSKLLLIAISIVKSKGVF